MIRRRATLRHRGRPQRVFSRWSSQSPAPIFSLILADMLVLTVWEVYILGLPQLSYSLNESPSILRILSETLQSSEFATAIAISLGWFVALHILPVHSRRRIISPTENPQRYLALTLIAASCVTLAAMIVPGAVMLPPMWLTSGATGGLIALTHWGFAYAYRLYTPRRFRTMLLAPASTVGALRTHLSKYDKLLHSRIVGVMRWDDRIPVMPAGMAEHFTEILLAMKDCGASTLLIPHPGAGAMSDLEDLRWMLENEGLYLDTILEPLAVGRNQADLDVAPGIAIVRTTSRQDTWVHALTKRLFDMVFSAVAIVLLTPLWVFLIIKIHHDDGGPAFFVQERVGRGGRLFPMLKFRTMVTDAEAQLRHLRDQELSRSNDDFIDSDNADTGVLFKLKNDPRITPIGAILRRTSMDELPQLFNVFVGHMSLVGPRPPLPHEVEQYAPRVRRKFNVRPGITGLWQVSGRSDLSWTESVRLDLYYVENRSIAFDTKILIKTIRAVSRQSGAY